MKKALIIVQSKNSTAQRFGEAIAEFLNYRGLASELIPINGFDPKYLNGTDYVLLSGWKNESLFSTKHPDNEWEEFVKKLPSLKGIKTALFAANKYLSGGMLKNMKRYLSKKTENLEYTFKSSDGYLTVSDKLVLNEFIK